MKKNSNSSLKDWIEQMVATVRHGFSSDKKSKILCNSISQEHLPTWVNGKTLEEVDQFKQEQHKSS